jgi:tetratricopeptide (TPR) repeat protein
LADTCLLITIGLLQFRQNHSDQAIVTLTQAYRANVSPARTEQRVLAAAALSSAMRETGDYSQALALNKEVIEWETAQDATLSLSVSHFLRGSTLFAMGKHPDAIDEFSASRVLSARVADHQGIAFADVNTCEALIKLGRIGDAHRHCADALPVFLSAHSTDMVKQTRGLLAQIDLIRGNARRARATLDEVLDKRGSDIGARRVASVYQLRAQADAVLHDYSAAYADLSEYVRRYVAANDVERTRQSAALRAHFEMDRQIERNASLQQDLEMSKARSARQTELLRWMWLGVGTGALVIGLLVYILIANVRHRRQLLQFARRDELTGLPNRRYTSELASAQLSASRAAGDRNLAYMASTPDGTSSTWRRGSSQQKARLTELSGERCNIPKISKQIKTQISIT